MYIWWTLAAIVFVLLCVIDCTKGDKRAIAQGLVGIFGTLLFWYTVVLIFF